MTRIERLESTPKPSSPTDRRGSKAHFRLQFAAGGAILRLEFGDEFDNRAHAADRGDPLTRAPDVLPRLRLGEVHGGLVGDADEFGEDRGRDLAGEGDPRARDFWFRGGSTVLVDLRDSELDGQQAEDRLHRVGITVNRNAVPNDPRPPMVTSGLRIGTPALATRGFGDAEFTEVADIIGTALAGNADLPALRARVAKLALDLPLYDGLENWGLLSKNV